MRNRYLTVRSAPWVDRPASFLRLLGALLVLLLAGPGRGWAQAPAWELAVSGNSNLPGTSGSSGTNAAAVDAQGNVFITGSFTGIVTFGNIRLVSAGGYDVFVAKWDTTARAFTWATSGGGTSSDTGLGIAVSGNAVYVTGQFYSGTNTRIAGQALPGTGTITSDMFVAKYVDTSTGHTLATGSFANAWATSGGGRGYDLGFGIAVSGSGVYVTGYFDSGNSAIIAGQALPGMGLFDIFVAKYLDTSTGNTPATSSFANGWATSAGGLGDDVGQGIAVRGTSVFVTGSFNSGTGASIAGQALAGTGTYNTDIFVAKYTDTSTGSTPATSSVANGWATSAGGTSDDRGLGIAVSGRGVFVTGCFQSGTATRIAGQALAGAGSSDVFVAKYLDMSTGSTPATSSFANGWATSAGGPDFDRSHGIALSGTSVFVTGYFQSGPGVRFAGQALAGAGYYDVFAAKFLDTSTGNTPATSSFANGWAISAGGPGTEQGNSIVVSGQQVYVAGQVNLSASFGSLTLGSTGSGDFLARLTDRSLLLATQPASPADPGLALFPNPAPGGAATLRGSAPGTPVQVVDALGRVVATASADAAGTATWPAGLTPGVYVVRNAGRTMRLVVQ